MTVSTGSARIGWRRRWADRRNAERTRAFEAVNASWQHDDQQARQMLAAAQTFKGIPPEQVPPLVDLHRSEEVYVVLPGVALVEPAAQPVLPPPNHRGFSPFPGRGAPPVVAGTADAGLAIVTNRRVILVGRHRREWQYTKLAGLAFLPDNRTTLMRVTNRVNVSGLAADPAVALGLRFNIALALADFAGRRAEFRSFLESQITEHQRYRPEPPRLVTPDQAPLSAMIRPPVVIAGAASAVLLLCLGIGLVAPKTTPQSDVTNPNRDAAAAGIASSPRSEAVPTHSPAPASPSAVVSAPGAASPAAALPPVAPPATTAPAPPPARATTSAPKPVNLCGAPPNPYGYNYCGRGSLITQPAQDVCTYFSCIGNFWNGVGYMMECNDGMVSMSGGRQGSCSHHSGDMRPVYDG